MGPIDLEKIKQVHQEMMRRQTEFAAERERFDFDEGADCRRPSKNLTRLYDDSVAAIEAKVVRNTSDAMPRADVVTGRPSHAPKHTAIRIEPARAKRHDCDARSKTLKLWAEEVGMNRATLVSRLKRGASLAEALRTPVREPKEPGKAISLKTLIVFREQEMTLERWAQHFGIKSSTIINRLRHGWEVELALTLHPGEVMGRKAKGGRWLKTSSEAIGTGGDASRAMLSE